MADLNIVEMMKDHYESLFPKQCSKCGRTFQTLQEFILNTLRIDPAIPHDAELQNWRPARPLGIISYSNCTCENTLALTTKGMPISHVHALLEWIKVESERQNKSYLEITNYLRDEIRKLAMLHYGLSLHQKRFQP